MASKLDRVLDGLATLRQPLRDTKTGLEHQWTAREKQTMGTEGRKDREGEADGLKAKPAWERWFKTKNEGGNVLTSGCLCDL
jgi:hypothetical protein